MASLRDIAKRAGTSISTVSLVLNDRASNVRISEATRQAVLRAASELGYTPHLAARRLRSNGQARRSLVLAVAHPIDSRLSLISRIISGMQQYLATVKDKLDAQELDVQLTIETFAPGELRRLRGLNEPLWYNGLLVTNTSPDDDAFINEGRIGVPLVVFQRYTEASSVNVDNRLAARQVTEHLLHLGHRRLAVIAPATSAQAHQLRIEGFNEAVAGRQDVRTEQLIAQGTTWTESAYETASQLLRRSSDERPTAVFATNDLLALGVIRAARDRGVHVPEELAVVGFDDAEFAQYMIPALTSVHLPIEEMAAGAAAILLDLIQRKVSPPVQRMFAPRLVIRESCGATATASDAGGTAPPLAR